VRRTALILVSTLLGLALIPQGLTAALEVIVDNPDALVVGTWDTETSAAKKYGKYSLD